ncbi:MAG: sulfite exporter TauE/SafE family protein, partial [Microthrixaceae bacterium]
MTSTQLLVVFLASALGALVKSVTGLGYPVLAVPVISLVLGIESAVVIVAIPNLASNIFLCWESRDARDQTRDLGRLCGFGVLGAVIGTIALVRLPEEPMLILLALSIFGFIFQFFRKPELALSAEVTRRWSPAVGLLAGAMQGAIGVSGPIVATWTHIYQLSIRAYIHSITLIFGVTGAVQLLILLLNGQMSSARVLGAVVASLAVAVVTPIGLRLRGRLAGDAFQKLVLITLLVSAGAL